MVNESNQRIAIQMKLATDALSILLVMFIMFLFSMRLTAGVCVLRMVKRPSGTFGLFCVLSD